jgi:hypothetical protein
LRYLHLLAANCNYLRHLRHLRHLQRHFFSHYLATLPIRPSVGTFHPLASPPASPPVTFYLLHSCVLCISWLKFQWFSVFTSPCSKPSQNHPAPPKK